MYFGSTNGLCYFTPSYILEKRQAPKAIIGKITVFEPLVSENSNETEISLINKKSVQLKTSAKQLQHFIQHTRLLTE